MDNAATTNTQLDIIANQSLVRTLGRPGTLESFTLTIDGTDDVITDVTAPLQAEVIGIISTAGSKRCRVTYHYQPYPGNALAADVYLPACSAAMVTLNAGTAGTAVSRFTITDVGGGDTTSTDARHRMIGPGQASVEYNLEGTDSTVDDVWIGAIPPFDAGEATPVFIPIYVSVEIW